MYWRCDHCRQLHTQNPKECRQCGHGVFQPVTEAELERAADGVDAPAAMDRVRTTGSTDVSVGSPSPDVAPDGSIDREEQASDGPSGPLARLLQWIRTWF